jgi:hypothetical protein
VRRLPEQFDPTDPTEAYGAALLAKVRPLEPSTSRKRRIWLALQDRPVRRATGRPSGAVIAGLVLCGATAASGAISHFWTRWQPAPEVVAAAPPAIPDPPRRGEPSPRAPATQPIESLQAQPPPIVPRSAPSKPRAADQVEPSAAVMVEAMRARRAGNFARARDLSSEYRVKYPTGALHEEALALSIEAAAALGEPDASRLAAAYLQRYPQGRFRGQAQRALGSAR